MPRNKGSLSPWNIDENDFPENGGWESKLKFLIRYAILAASTHNTQPWKFKISSERIAIGPDFKRSRMAGDPDGRELFISLGCAAANLETAAKHFGLIYQKEYEIDDRIGEGRIVLTFENGRRIGEKSRLFGAIRKRLTNRNEYHRKSIPKKLVEEIEKLERYPEVGIRMVMDKEQRAIIGDIIAKSNRVWFRSRELVEELEGWLRDDVRYSTDGLPIGVLNIYKIAVNLKYLLARESEEITRKAEKDRQLAVAAPMLAVVYSKSDGVENWIKTGEYYQRLALGLTCHGVANAFFNTVLELKNYRRKLAQILRLKGRPQLCLRLGYAKTPGIRSSRRPLKDVLVE